MTDTKQQVLDHLARCGALFMCGEPPRDPRRLYLLDMGGCNAATVFWDEHRAVWVDSRSGDEIYDPVFGDRPRPEEWTWMRLPHPSWWPVIAPPVALIAEEHLSSGAGSVFDAVPTTNVANMSVAPALGRLVLSIEVDKLAEMIHVEAGLRIVGARDLYNGDIHFELFGVKQRICQRVGMASLTKALRLPAGVEVVGAFSTPGRLAVQIVLGGPALPPLPAGEDAPWATATYRRPDEDNEDWTLLNLEYVWPYGAEVPIGAGVSDMK